MRRTFLAAAVIAGALVVEGDDRGVGVRKNPPAPKPAAAEWIDAAHEQLLNSGSAIRVKLTTGAGKRLFHAGDVVKYEVTTNTPGYLYLIVFSEQNVATCIFPNEIDPENRVAAGRIRPSRAQPLSGWRPCWPPCFRRTCTPPALASGSPAAPPWRCAGGSRSSSSGSRACSGWRAPTPPRAPAPMPSNVALKLPGNTDAIVHRTTGTEQRAQRTSPALAAELGR